MLNWIRNLFNRNPKPILNRFNRNWRVHQNADQLWYFWDESDMAEVGPYHTQGDCVRAVRLYGKYLNKEIHYRQFITDSKLIRKVPHG